MSLQLSVTRPAPLRRQAGGHRRNDFFTFTDAWLA